MAAQSANYIITRACPSPQTIISIRTRCLLWLLHNVIAVSFKATTYAFVVIYLYGVSTTVDDNRTPTPVLLKSYLRCYAGWVDDTVSMWSGLDLQHTIISWIHDNSGVELVLNAGIAFSGIGLPTQQRLQIPTSGILDSLPQTTACPQSRWLVIAVCHFELLRVGPLLTKGDWAYAHYPFESNSNAACFYHDF